MYASEYVHNWCCLYEYFALITMSHLNTKTIHSFVAKVQSFASWSLCNGYMRYMPWFHVMSPASGGCFHWTGFFQFSLEVWNAADPCRRPRNLLGAWLVPKRSTRCGLRELRVDRGNSLVHVRPFLMLFRLFGLGCLQFPRTSRALCQKFEKWQDWLGRTMPELNCLPRSRSTQIQWLGFYESLHFTYEGRQQNRHGNVASFKTSNDANGTGTGIGSSADLRPPNRLRQGLWCLWFLRHPSLRAISSAAWRTAISVTLLTKNASSLGKRKQKLTPSGPFPSYFYQAVESAGSTGIRRRRSEKRCRCIAGPAFGAGSFFALGGNLGSSAKNRIVFSVFGTQFFNLTMQFRDLFFPEEHRKFGRSYKIQLSNNGKLLWQGQHIDGEPLSGAALLGNLGTREAGNKIWFGSFGGSVQAFEIKAW